MYVFLFCNFFVFVFKVSFSMQIDFNCCREKINDEEVRDVIVSACRVKNENVFVYQFEIINLKNVSTPHRV